MDANLGLDQDLINAVAAITEASCSAKKLEKEELHPNQKVLDKNNNGKLDDDDFKKLRKEGVLDQVRNSSSSATGEKRKDDGVKNFNGKTGAAQRPNSSLEAIRAKMRKEDTEVVEEEQLDEISASTMRSAAEKLKNKALDARMDDNKYAFSHYKGRSLDMSAKAAKKENQNRELTKEQVEEIEAIAAKHGLGE